MSFLIIKENILMFLRSYNNVILLFSNSTALDKKNSIYKNSLYKRKTSLSSIRSLQIHQRPK